MVTSPSECIVNDFGLAKYYTVVDGACVFQSSFFNNKPFLPESVGYVVVVGFGAFFAVITAWLIHLEQRYVGTRQSSEWFNTAGRSVKTGLIASVIVSQWTWAATLLQSSNVAYKNGVSGPFWYASGATVQVLLFGVMAIEIKRKAPNAHTMCEVVKARWGTAAHIVMLSFGFLTNIIVTAMLLLGGSAVVNALTGMNIYAASFLIPVGVLVYTLHGGLKATFLAAYLHSFVLHIVLLIFIFMVYCTSPDLGSPKAVYDKLQFYVARNHSCTYKNDDQSCGPVEGNRGGSYVTMLSTNGLIFGIINIIGNFGTVFVDNGYWMSAIAARPSSTHKGYLLGGLVWFCIPFAMGTSLGLGALALDLPITLTEAGQGLVPPATAAALLGKTGAVLILTMVFMAVTSAGSHELIAVSTLLTYDVYRTYIKPDASGKEILFVSRVCVAVFGLIMGVLAILLNEAGVSLGWMYLVMGVLIGSAVVPVALLLLWEKANGAGAIAGSIIGMIVGIAVWMGTTGVEYGRIDLNTTGKDAPTLAGNMASIFTGGLIHVVFSLISPQNFDWEATKAITRVEIEKADFDPVEDSEEALNHARWWIIKWGIVWTVLIVFLWPVLALPAGVFSEGYFTMWAVISIIWATIGSAIIIIMPLWEHWETLYMIFEGLFSNDILLQKLDDVGLKVSAILATNPDAEKVYLLEKEKLKAMRDDLAAPGLELKELAGEGL